MNKIIESLKNIYKDNKYIFSIQILICSFFAFLLGLSRGARSHSRLERIMAEYISSKVGFDFHPVWLSVILILISCTVLFLLFVPCCEIVNYFKKKKKRVYLTDTSPYKKKSKNKKKKRK